MLPRSKRVSTGLFEELFQKGKNLSTEYITLRFFVLNTPTPPRFSVAVSKKVVKTAVGRNRIRRRVYTAIEKVLKTSNQFNSFPVHGVLFIKKDIATLSHEAFVSEIAFLFGRIRLQ